MANTFDDAVKALCAVDLTGLCRWLGAEVRGSAAPLRLAESAPPTTTRQVDLLVGVDHATVLHVEFQTRPEPRFAQRMLDYWLRLDAHAELRGRTIVQHVVLLGDGRLDDGLRRSHLRFSYEVHHLRDEDPERFLADASLVPFAALGRLTPARRPEVLRRALDRVAAVEDHRVRDLLAHATVALAAVRLDPGTINAAWKESAMPIPSILNRMYDEGAAHGREQGLVEAVASLLRVRFGDDPRLDAVAADLAGRGPATAMAAVEEAADLDELLGPPPAGR